MQVFVFRGKRSIKKDRLGILHMVKSSVRKNELAESREGKRNSEEETTRL